MVLQRVQDGLEESGVIFGAQLKEVHPAQLEILLKVVGAGAGQGHRDQVLGQDILQLVIL